VAEKAVAPAEEKAPVVVVVERAGVAEEASPAFLPQICPAQQAGLLEVDGETRLLQTSSGSMLSVM
jgi:hypothetical protein